jgi:type VI protein secretion system component VasF
MVRVKFWLQLLLLLFILRQSAAKCDQCGELNDEISNFTQNILTRLTALEYQNEIVVSQYYVICCYCDTAICSVMLCGGLLCCLFVVTVIELYVSY